MGRSTRPILLIAAAVVVALALRLAVRSLTPAPQTGPPSLSITDEIRLVAAPPESLHALVGLPPRLAASQLATDGFTPDPEGRYIRRTPIAGTYVLDEVIELDARHDKVFAAHYTRLTDAPIDEPYRTLTVP